MPKPKTVVGLDIGSSSIKLIELQQTKDGIEVTNWASAPTEIDPYDLSIDKGELIVEAANKLLNSLNVNLKNTVVCIAGQSVFVRWIRLPATSDDHLVKMIRYEAKQQIPFPLEKVILEYQIFHDLEEREVGVLLVAIKKDLIDEQVGSFHEIGLSPRIIDVSTLAIFNAHSHWFFSQREEEEDAEDEYVPEEVTAIVNIGASTTDICIQRGRRLGFPRSAPIGGNDITRAIHKSTNMSFAEAERFKIEKVTLFEEEDEDPTVAMVRGDVNMITDRIISEIRRTIDYYISLPEGDFVTNITLCGGSSALRGLPQLIEDRFNIPTEISDFYTSFSMKDDILKNESDKASSVIALGLALRGIEEMPLQINFLPSHIKDIKELGERQIQIYIVGALLIIAVVMSYLLIQAEINLEKAKIRQVTDLQGRPGDQKEYNEARDKFRDYKARIDSLKEILDRKTSGMDLFSKIFEVTPEAVYYKSINAQEEGVVVLSGYAFREGEISTLNSRLETVMVFTYTGAKKLFKQVEITDISKSGDKFSFELKCTQVED
jgi:type IV pilus assembly protein PilM